MPAETTHRDLGPLHDDAPESLDALLPKRKVVVTIGIDAYQKLPRLKRAVADAAGVQRLLMEQFGFVAPVPPLTNADATKSAIEALVYDRLRELLGPDDALFLFFAGHGTSRVDRVGSQSVEHGYLAPVEAEGGNRYSDLVDVEHFLDQVGALPARHVLVVLDACDSGMALGARVQQYRGVLSFARDLARKLSRRVITSAQRDQPALDGGPNTDHSLFTGTLIDGLRWAKAAFGNEFVTSSSLGLYLQQQVGLASSSRQTPDFGSFHLDDRGELLLPIGEGSFESLRASAYAALQRGERKRFTELTGKAVALRPEAPETLYLSFREALIEGDIDRALALAKKLGWRPLEKGHIPLSYHDLQTLVIMLSFWGEVLRVQPDGFPLNVQLLAGRDQGELAEIQPQRIGDLDGYSVEIGGIIVFRVTNPTDHPAHLYFISFDAVGRMNILRPWRDIEVMFSGLAPGATDMSLPFKVLDGDEGIEEIWAYYSPERFDKLLSPYAATSRSASLPISTSQVASLRLKKMYVHHASPKAPT